MTDSAIGGLVSNLPELENLDLRGCKQVLEIKLGATMRRYSGCLVPRPFLYREGGLEDVR